MTVIAIGDRARTLVSQPALQFWFWGRQVAVVDDDETREAGEVFLLERFPAHATA